MKKEVVEKYLKSLSRNEYHRYKSWDNCFKSFSEIERSKTHSLELAFYLASWGMYRGSSGLLQKNHLIHEGAVEIIYESKYRGLRCNRMKEVGKKDIPLILDLKKDLHNYYERISESAISATDTLISKILLGTMGCVPAYDRYFRIGLKDQEMRFSMFNKSSLEELFSFIDLNENVIEICQNRVKNTINQYYPKMKIVDMYFWQIGVDKAIQKKLFYYKKVLGYEKQN